MLVVGCTNKVTYELEFPVISEDSGYAIDMSGTFSSSSGNKHTVNKGEDISFVIRTLEGYTFENIIVRDNGKVMEYTKIPSTDDERYQFNLNKIDSSHKITVEGIGRKKFNFSFNLGKYRESENDTGGSFANYAQDTIIVKYGDTLYESLTLAINDINSKNIKIGYGENFEIWVGEKYAKYYQQDSFYSLYISKSNSNGILFEKQGNNYDLITENVTAYVDYERDSNDNITYENNMYKYVIKNVKEDINLYFAPMKLAKNYYYLDYKSCEVYTIDTPDITGAMSVEAGAEWFFTVKMNGAEEYYTNMKAYVNGSEVSGQATEDPTIIEYTVKKPTPSSFNTLELEYYYITVTLPDLPKGNLTKIKVEHDKDKASINYYAKKGIDELQKPYYYEDEFHYYRKDVDTLYVWFGASRIFNYENMEVEINGVSTGKDHNYYSDDGAGGQYIINIEPVAGDYLEEYVIKITGIEKRKFEYKIKNQYASEVDLYLRYSNDVEDELISSTEKTFKFEDGDSFLLILKAKNEEADISNYIFTGFDNAEKLGEFPSPEAEPSPISMKEITFQVKYETSISKRSIEISKDN